MARNAEINWESCLPPKGGMGMFCTGSLDTSMSPMKLLVLSLVKSLRHFPLCVITPSSTVTLKYLQS